MSQEYIEALTSLRRAWRHFSLAIIPFIIASACGRQPLVLRLLYRVPLLSGILMKRHMAPFLLGQIGLDKSLEGFDERLQLLKIYKDVAHMVLMKIPLLLGKGEMLRKSESALLVPIKARAAELKQLIVQTYAMYGIEKIGSCTEHDMVEIVRAACRESFVGQESYGRKPLRVMEVLIDDIDLAIVRAKYAAVTNQVDVDGGKTATAQPEIVESKTEPAGEQKRPKELQTAEEWIVWLYQKRREINETRKAAGKKPLSPQGSRKIATFLAAKGIKLSHVTVLKKIKKLGDLRLLDDAWDISDTNANQGSLRLDSISSGGQDMGSQRSAGQRAKLRPNDEANLEYND